MQYAPCFNLISNQKQPQITVKSVIWGYFYSTYTFTYFLQGRSQQGI